MGRTEQLQGLRLMKFEDIYGRTYRGELGQMEAAEILELHHAASRVLARFTLLLAGGKFTLRLFRDSGKRRLRLLSVHRI